ncbi:hypothetical protein PHYBLDRAFT_185527 [Phycomyces blakesleeanus NRRL 1555(-)]|uniref:SWR1-complex protein 5 n=2 Tax=Phycomyces blakesleeanus TaxID=4837 RepID=A0A162PZR6_PHYB8|nr:hypothetical protein PHYBLDRAFT_185527 [Phycomyces blakesleeanus NRRL 1555(-)]OAD77517.1 hypothetical protein PHYBLDRAFT_185527 [Phycomyces blakesleeanus NRRL 1555(-)]|eukprot:XP_018295557.1 hypothetical protein PHYBLDRAFT_185527 [Phycomyces blakesleeanus NRRL 1555(-)]
MDSSEQKAKIDAIWAEMNVPKTLAAKEPIKTNILTNTNANNTNSNTITNSTTKGISDPPSILDAPTLKSLPLGRKKKSGLVRPKSKLSDLVTQYNVKVPKMNTLEKSRLDWQGYVDREGIRADLKYQNKDGYMEKVAFLQRVEDRRFTHLKTGQRESKNNK